MEVIQNTIVEYTEIVFFGGDYPQFMMLFGMSYGQTWGLKMHHFEGADPCRMEVWGQGGQRDGGCSTEPGLFLVVQEMSRFP